MKKIKLFCILIISMILFYGCPDSAMAEDRTFISDMGDIVKAVTKLSNELTIRILPVEGRPLTADEREGQGLGKLSQLSFLNDAKTKLFTKIFSGLSVADVTRLWNDLVWLEENTDIKDVHIFINSPGGDAFSGLALADQIERAKRKGFNITAHASGIIASAAVPVFTVCSKRLAAPGTIFMVHEAALWKWPGRETASDIRSQNELMNLLRERYIGKLVENSKTSKEDWEKMEHATSWFSAEKAMELGIADQIE